MKCPTPPTDGSRTGRAAWPGNCRRVYLAADRFAAGLLAAAVLPTAGHPDNPNPEPTPFPLPCEPFLFRPPFHSRAVTAAARAAGPLPIYLIAIGSTVSKKSRVHEARIRDLLVEDHEDTRRLAATILGRNGFDVATGATKAEALAICRSEPFHVLLCDVQLPDGSGLDLMRELAEICGIKEIAYTGHAFESDVKASLAAGFATHLTKPTDVQTLIETVRRVGNWEKRQPDANPIANTMDPG